MFKFGRAMLFTFSVLDGWTAGLSLSQWRAPVSVCLIWCFHPHAVSAASFNCVWLNKTMKLHQKHRFPFSIVQSRWYGNGFCLVQVFLLLWQRVSADCCNHIAVSSNSHGKISPLCLHWRNPLPRKRLSGTPAWCLFKGDIKEIDWEI